MSVGLVVVFFFLFRFMVFLGSFSCVNCFLIRFWLHIHLLVDGLASLCYLILGVFRFFFQVLVLGLWVYCIISFGFRIEFFYGFFFFLAGGSYVLAFRVVSDCLCLVWLFSFFISKFRCHAVWLVCDVCLVYLSFW